MPDDIPVAKPVVKEPTVSAAPRIGLRSPKYSEVKAAKKTHDAPSAASAVVRPGVSRGRFATRRLFHSVRALLTAQAGANIQPGGDPGGVRRRA